MKKTTKLPYCVSLYLSMDAWAVLCGFFGIFLIFSRVEFETPEIKLFVLLSGLFFIFIAAIFAPAEYGLFRLFGKRFRFLSSKIERQDAKILNDNIIDGIIPSNLPTSTLKAIFFALVRRPTGGAKTGVSYGLAVTILMTFVAGLVGTSMLNVFVILINGVLATLLLTLFGIFFVERFISPALKECRKILKEKGEDVEGVQLFVLKNRFYYFVILLALIVAIILTFVPAFTITIVIIVLIGLAMTAMISRVLFSLIYDIFLEIRDFTKKLPQSEKVVFSSGSLAKEVGDLSKALNQSAKEIYEAREKERRARKEIEKRKEDLEKFYKLTVGRELRMIELKKQIKELEEKFKKEE